MTDEKKPADAEMEQACEIQMDDIYDVCSKCEHFTKNCEAMKRQDIIERQAKEHAELKQWNAELQSRYTVLAYKAGRRAEQIKAKHEALLKHG